MKKYIWHLASSPWEKIMEKIEDGPIISFKKVHEKYLGKRNNLGWFKFLPNDKKMV